MEITLRILQGGVEFRLGIQTMIRTAKLPQQRRLADLTVPEDTHQRTESEDLPQGCLQIARALVGHVITKAT